MPVTKEFIVLMEDRPSTLGKLCQALADRGVNILALQAFPIGGKTVTRFIVDNPTTAKTVLDTERLTYVEAEIVQAKLPHRPGEIARVASRLGEANININYAYCGLEPGTNTPLVSLASPKSARQPQFLSRPQPPLRSFRLRRISKLSHGSGRYLLPVIFGTGPQQWRSSLSLR